MNKYSQRENNRYDPQSKEPFYISRWTFDILRKNKEINLGIKAIFRRKS